MFLLLCNSPVGRNQIRTRQIAPNSNSSHLFLDLYLKLIRKLQIEVLIKVYIRAEIKLSKCDRTPVRLDWTWPSWWPGLMISACPQAGWVILWESQAVCDSPAAWNPQKFTSGMNAEASVPLQMLGPFLQHTLVQPQCEKCISLFPPAVFPHKAAPEYSRRDSELNTSCCRIFVFIILRFFSLQMLFTCRTNSVQSCREEGKKAWRIFTWGCLYVCHMLHTCTSFLILSALCFLHRELDSSCEFFWTLLPKKIIS